MWSMLVDLVRATIFATSHLVAGSLGAAVVLVTAGVRLALMPLALKAARRANAEQAKLRTLEPQLLLLERRHSADPQRLATERQALYRANGVSMFGGAASWSLLIQMPLLGALFSAVRGGLGAGVRFLWIRNLGKSDLVAMLIAAGLSGLMTRFGPSGPAGSPVTPRMMLIVNVGITMLVLWSAPSVVALSFGTGSLVSALQNWLLRREARSLSAST